MSYHKIKDVLIPANIPRDYFMPFAKSAAFKVDLYQEQLVVGLDLLIHNRGASSLTVKIDGGDSITVLAGDTYSMENIKYAFVSVTSSVDYDLILAGIHLKTLRRDKRGL